MESMMIYVPIIMAIIGLLFMWIKRAWVLKQDAGDGKMKEISDYIYEGALAFLESRIPLINFLCYWCKYRFSSGSLLCSNYTLFNSSSIYFWCNLLCPCGKYGNENRNRKLTLEQRKLPVQVYRKH
jgi:hypothetical protein